VTVLGVVTARAGSKGIPGKNTRCLAGRPLIVYTFEAARESKVFDRLILSTDDAEAAALAVEHGCEVPFYRPASLAADDTPHLPVLQHALAWLRDHEGYAPDRVMILQPTSPLRQAWHIREAVDLALASGADSVVSVDELPPHFNPLRVVTIDEGGWAHLFVGGRPVKTRPARRQDLPQTWVLNGAIYLFRTALLFDPTEPSLYGDKVAAYRMSSPFGFNIDQPEDWAVAEQLVARMAGGTGDANALSLSARRSSESV
jgi:CMP-N,N'-diacetyllegionaminic acid synthase